jgi:hypothetical protein
MTTVAHPQPAPRRPSSAAVSSSSRRLPLGLAAIALGLVAVALLGPLVSGVIDYRVTETLRNQTIGLDFVSLVAVAPLALGAAFLVVRGRALGFALALGIGAYSAYMLLQCVVGPDYAHQRGNNERLFPLALLLFASGWAVALAAWNALDGDALPLSPRRARLLSRVVLPALALLAFGRYIPSLADWMSSSPKDKVYLAGPSFGWAIALLDLGVFLPLTVAACVGLNRRRPWATKALYTAVTWFGLVGPAVAAMAITMAVNNDPNGSTGNAVFMSVLGLAFLALALVVYQPLLRCPTRRRGETVGATPLGRRGRIAVAAIGLIVGVGAVFGGVGLLSDAERLGAKQVWLDGSPFPNYVVPGIVLLVVVGGGMLATAAAALARSRIAGGAAFAMGVVLLVWGVVETATIGYEGAAQLVLLAGWVVGPALPLLKLGHDAGASRVWRHRG